MGAISIQHSTFTNFHIFHEMPAECGNQTTVRGLGWSSISFRFYKNSMTTATGFPWFSKCVQCLPSQFLHDSEIPVHDPIPFQTQFFLKKITNSIQFQSFFPFTKRYLHQASPRPDGSSRGFAFIRFAAVESVDRAIEVGLAPISDSVYIYIII